MCLEEYAYNKGYYVEKGELFGPKGKRKLNEDTKGYPNATISIGSGKLRRRLYVHRMVAFQKYGKQIYSKNVEVRHLNGNKNDNSIQNILIGTHQENMMDIPKSIRIRTAKNASISRRRLSDEEAQKIILDREIGMTYSEIGQKYGLSKSFLSYFYNHSLQNPKNQRK